MVVLILEQAHFIAVTGLYKWSKGLTGSKLLLLGDISSCKMSLETVINVTSGFSKANESNGCEGS